MPLPLSRQEVRDRIRDYSHDNYIYIGSVVNGAALAVAALVLLQILSDFGNSWLKLSPWVASVASICVSYLTWGRGVLLTNSRSNFRDAVVPLLMGIMKFLLFAILLQNEGNEMIWLHWFGVLFLHTGMAVCLIRNRIENTKVECDFTPDMQDLGIKLLHWMHEDQRGARRATRLSLIFWIIVQTSDLLTSYAPYILFALALLVSKQLFQVANRAVNQRIEIDAYVSQESNGTESHQKTRA